MRKIWFIALFALALVSCKRTEEEDATLKQFGEGTPVKEAFQVHFTFSENAIMQAELEAAHAIETKENGQDVRLFDKKLHLVFFSADGVKESDLTADKGIFRNQFNEAEVIGNVLMINVNGDSLQTEHLWWNKTTNRIHTDHNFVKITTPTEEIRGDSLDANTDFTEYKIFNMKGTVNVQDENL